jgi:hypothetical protein
MTMREDVRTAFQHQQAALGDIGDARHRLVHAALVKREHGQSRGLQWAAGVAAVLIAAIVITTFALVKAGGHSTTVPAATPSPRALASPTPLSNPLVVPPGTPVILYHDPASFDQIDGVTWDGKTSGKVGSGATNGGIASPDGSRYQTLGDKAAASVVWADDSTHYCTVVRTRPSDVAAPGMLQIVSPGQAPKNVARVGSIGGSGSNAGGPVIIACSPAADRAVVYQAGGQGVGAVYFQVIQLSTGRTIWSYHKAGAWIAASHDGRFVALSQLDGPSTVFGADGSVAGTVSATVFSFSWDGSLAVVASNYGGQPSIIDWRDGQTIWTCPLGVYQYVQSFAEPRGSHLAIGASLPSYKNTNGFQPVDLFVVGADGVVAFENKDVALFGQ